MNAKTVSLISLMNEITLTFTAFKNNKKIETNLKQLYISLENETLNIKDTLKKDTELNENVYNAFNYLTKMRTQTEHLSRWELFCEDMMYIYQKYKKIPCLMELITLINDKKNNTDLQEEEIAKMEDLFTNVRIEASNNLYIFDEDRAYNLINAKLRLFKKRSNKLNNEYFTSFGMWLKEKRKEKKLTLQALSNISGVSAGYINRLEKGERRAPSIQILEKLSKALDISLQDILKKLNLNSPQENIDSDIDSDISAMMGFSELNNEQKKMVQSLMLSIINSPWTNETKISDSSKILKEIEEFKNSTSIG